MVASIEPALDHALCAVGSCITTRNVRTGSPVCTNSHRTYREPCIQGTVHTESRAYRKPCMQEAVCTMNTHAQGTTHLAQNANEQPIPFASYIQSS